MKASKPIPALAVMYIILPPNGLSLPKIGLVGLSAYGTAKPFKTSALTLPILPSRPMGTDWFLPKMIVIYISMNLATAPFIH